MSCHLHVSSVKELELCVVNKEFFSLKYLSIHPFLSSTKSLYAHKMSNGKNLQLNVGKNSKPKF